MPGAGHAVKRWAFVVGATVSPGGDRALVLLGEDREVDGYWGQESWCNPVGPVALALRAPAGATSAIVRYDGREHRVSVSDRGWVFFAAWDHPYPESAGPDWWWAIKAPPALVSFG
jgi:hypothetical protein